MKDKRVSIPMTILSLAIGVIVIFPIIWLVLSSFKPSGELFTYPLHMFPSTPTTEHYSSVLAGGFMGYVKNSLFLAVVGTLITLLISAMCGYALAIYRFEIKYVNLVFGVFLLGTLIPGETVVLLSHKKADSYIHIDVEFGEGEGKIPVDSMAFHNGSYDKVRRDSIWQRKKMK